MIRTHKPRGFAWVCASAFQQTPQIRDISYDDSAVHYNKDDILHDDSEDDYSLEERAAKRRRIEQLADDYLNGYPLLIRSARPTYQDTEDAIIQHFALPKVGRRDFQDACAEATDADLWEESEDEAEVLQAFIESGRRLKPQTIDAAAFMLNAVETVQDDLVTQVQAQASCGPKRNLRPARVSIGPSEDALRKAAELRNRKGRKPLLDSRSESEPQSCPRIVIAETQTQPSFESTTDETESDCGPSPTPAWTSSKWLRSGVFEMRRKAVDEDCSRDELGPSSFFTASQQSRLATRPLAVNRSNGQASFQNVATLPESIIPPTSFDSILAQDGTVPESEEPIQHLQPGTGETFAASVVYETAPDACDPPTQNDSQKGDSQTQLLRRQGIKAAPRKSWATVNDASGGQQAVPDSDQLEVNGTPVSTAIRESLQQSAALHAGAATKGRRAKSAGNTPADATRKTSNRRRTAPSESQNLDNEMAKLPEDQRQRIGAFRVQYSSVDVNGNSPFMFRKRMSKFNTSDEPDIEPIPVQPKAPAKTPRRRVEFPSSDAPQMSEQALAGTTSVAQKEQLVPAPHTPLVAEHLNRVLPKDASSGRRSSSVRKALREEMLASGAEFSRCAGDASSQPEEATAAQTSSHDEPDPSANVENDTSQALEPAVESQPKQLWPGTQQFLAQAQNGLFDSPDKTESALYLGDKTTPRVQAGGMPRRPLQTLSQERMPLPSTQAMLQDWPGWSSVKKPRSDGKRPSIGHSPSVGKGGMITFASDPMQSNDTARRRSSLRFSMSFNDSPALSITKMVNPEPANTASTIDNDSFLKPAPRKSSGKIASSLSFGFSSIDVPAENFQPPDDDLPPPDESFIPYEPEGPDPFASVCPPMVRSPSIHRQSMDSQELDNTITWAEDF